MTYLTDGPSLIFRRRSDQHRRRLIVAMGYLLPFVLAPLALGSVALHFSIQSRGDLQDLDAIEFAINDMQQRLIAGGSSLSLEERDYLNETIIELRGRLQAASTARQWYATRGWAIGFLVVGAVLLCVWAIVMGRLIRGRFG